MSAKTTAKNPVKTNKKDEEAKTKRNTIITIVICVCLAVIVTVPAVKSEIQHSRDRVYATDDKQTITLRENGTFTARLAHTTKNGTYTLEDQMSFIIVMFTSDGQTTGGLILNDTLQLPADWDDGHGHGVDFHLKK